VTDTAHFHGYGRKVRRVDLALYADTLAGEAAAVAARIERERGRMRQAEIERAAARDLPVPVVATLRELGLLGTSGDVRALAELEESLDAVEALQAWVEERLARAAA
jgi:hypothetical protein